MPNTETKFKQRFGQGIRRYRYIMATDLAGYFLIAAAIAVALTFAIAHGTIFEELELSLLIVSALLFVMLTYGLYHGYALRGTKRLNDEGQDAGGDDTPWWDRVLDTASYAPSFDLDVGDDGCLSSILMVVAWIAATIVIAATLMVIGGMLVASLTAVFWVFIRAMRIVFIKSRICKGDLVQSATYAFMYTGLYTFWLLAIVVGLEMFLDPPFGPKI